MNANEIRLTTVAWKRLPDGATLEFGTLSRTADGFALAGLVVGVEASRPLLVNYRVRCDTLWQSREAVITQTFGDLVQVLRLETAPEGGWLVNGLPQADLADCTDIDLGLSPSTNALPVNRLQLPAGGRSEITAAWVRFPGLDVVPARQAYERTAVTRFTYEGLASGFRARLEIDAFGLPVAYEGVWKRLAQAN